MRFTRHVAGAFVLVFGASRSAVISLSKQMTAQITYGIVCGVSGGGVGRGGVGRGETRGPCTVLRGHATPIPRVNSHAVRAPPLPAPLQKKVLLPRATVGTSSILTLTAPAIVVKTFSVLIHLGSDVKILSAGCEALTVCPGGERGGGARE